MTLSTEQLLLGNEILPIFTNYPDISENRFLKIPAYTLKRVLDVNANDILLLPEPYQDQKALDIFIGYLVFDALIGNTDRHHQNWAWIWCTTTIQFLLAPTFDHASSLGRELTDEKRKMILRKKGRNNIEDYAKKARTPFFKNSKQNKTLTTYEGLEYISSNYSRVLSYWIEKFLAIKDEEITSIIDPISASLMTDAHKEFTQAFIKQNLTFLENLYWRIKC